MFYEGMIDELSTIGGSGSHSQDDVSFEEESIGNRKALGVKPQMGPINDDSDLEIEASGAYEHDGHLVGGSGSEKGTEL